jgi:MFS family permease
MGNHLWRSYVPKYLEALGASILVVGLYGSVEQLVGACYQYPGGVISDSMGSKNALVLFTATSIFGYVLYYVSKSWELFIVGTFFVLVWESMSQPAIFALIGETLPQSKRAMGFSVQSILRRVPIILASPIGGVLIQTLGLSWGMKIGFVASIIMALLAIMIQRKFYSKSRLERTKSSIVRLWKTMVNPLKRLLVSDILARLAGNMIGVYVVLYVLNVLKAPASYYGVMISLQMIASVLSYLPAAKLSDIYGRRPFVAASLFFFAMFPLALVLTPSVALLPLAFIVNGLREMGEPARKALIVDLAERGQRGKMVGLYYMIRETVNIPAPLVGGLLWGVSPQLLFYSACIIGTIGVAIFLLSAIVEED